ncbi:MAG: hypothetical protein M3Z25_11825 [Actinomycetota bacterium]|nr:hypothetical protein [Actinomycetota bacterium]
MGVHVNGKLVKVAVTATIAVTTGLLYSGTAFAGGNLGGEGGSSHHTKSESQHKHHGDCNDGCDRRSSDSDSACDGCSGDSEYHYSRYRQGGRGGGGGANNAKCLAPVGLSAGAVASSGGTVDQCNSSGANGGEGGAGDVNFDS